MRLKTLARFFRDYFFVSRKSYSQTGEDLIARFYLSDIKNGFYVDVGTNDPVHLNNTYLFYTKGWSGICIEPDQLRVGMIKLLRPRDIAVAEGVSQSAGNLDFYIFDPDTISTFSQMEAVAYQKLGHRLLATKKIPTRPLSAILDQYAGNKKIDLLSVDTEGLDLEVLASNNWENYRPKMVIVEASEYRKDHTVRHEKEFNEFMSSRNYVKLADTYINILYMDGDYAKAKHIGV